MGQPRDTLPVLQVLQVAALLFVQLWAALLLFLIFAQQYL
jgi:hypothetical protein